MLYKKSLRPLLVLLVLASLVSAQQTAPKENAVDAGRLRAHVTYLASDKLEGRRTGTPGANMAADYIASEFKRLGLKPLGDVKGAARGYLQTFPYIAAVELGKANKMTLTTRASGSAQPASLDMRVGEDWMPLGFSSNASIETTMVTFVGYGITAADQNYDDYKGADVQGNVALALAGTPDGDNPHGKFTRAGELRFKAAAARAAGAKALVVIASEENFKDDKLSRLRYDNAGGDAGLPVAVISRQAAAKVLGLTGTSDVKELEKWAAQRANPAPHGSDATNAGPVFKSADMLRHTVKGTSLSITTDIVRKNAPASNVVGVLEGADPKLKSETIVIGAHYDHLGRGGEGSRAAHEGEIHHGADDNASGTAGLLELARLFSSDKARMRRTLVFVAFSGEEEGLIGSSFHVANPALPLEQTIAMINMDMIGRLKEGALNIGGVGTATEWRGWIESANAGAEAKLAPTQPANLFTQPVSMNNSSVRFALRLNEDGYGPSDHSSFYLKRVPVLFFFTGSHEDYHKPSDTADKINYEGEARVLEFVREIVYDLQAADRRPTFAVAKTEANSRSTGFRVSIGTIPSYAESTDGLKLDGVREGSPAEAAGLKAGDKVVKLAGREIKNVYDYTQALSEMKAGQEYEVEVVRGEQRLTFKITPVARK